VSTSGANATISSSGSDASFYTTGADAHIYTTGANATIQTRTTFRLSNGTYTTTLSHAPSADRAIALPNAAGTLALTSDITGGTLAGSFTTLTASATTSLLLGTAGSAVGTIGFRNATSGITTLQPATGALGTGTVTLPLTGTLATLEGANTFTGANVNSTAGAASLPAMRFSGVPFAGTGTTSFPLVYINDANATASTTLNTAGTYFGVNGDGTQDLMNLLNDGVSKCKVSSAGTLFTAGSGMVDIAGAGGINAGAVWANGSIYGEGIIGNRNNGGIQIAASGVITLRNLAYTDAVSQLNFGNLSSASYPAWRRDASSTTIKARLSDNSADCPISASNATFSGTLAVTGATTLTGLLTANGGITLGDAQNIAFNTTTGTKIGAATTQKLSFWNATPIVQPTTAVASATVASPGGGVNIKTDDTFDGYTIAQVVKALRNAGLLA
jgi:hypothetical protein